MSLRVCLLICALAVVSKAQQFYGKNSGVVNLTPANFDAVAKGPGLTMVEFYAPWCGHCKNLKPEWSKAAKQMQGLVTFAAVDCDNDVNKRLASQYGIQGFPTIKAFIGGKAEDYNGARSASGMVDYANSRIPSAVKSVKDGSESKFLDNPLPKLLLFTKKSSTSALYKALSTKFKNKIVFGEARSKKAKKLASSYGVSDFPTLLFIPAGDEASPVKYEGSINAKSLNKFLSRQLGEEIDEDRLPVLHDQSCMEKYCVGPGGLCAILLTASDEKEATKYHDILLEVAESRDDELFTFAVLDGTKHEDFVGNGLGITLEYSKLVVYSAKKKSYIEFVGAFSHSSVAEFLQGILTGRHKPSKMSNVPALSGDTTMCPKTEKRKKDSKKKKEKSSGGGGGAPNVNYVVPLSDSNFTDIISNRKLPMMVEFFAPWCGHCKNLAPEWSKAARNLQGMVMFATVDATVETRIAQQYQIQGYPTIKYFSARPTSDPFDAGDYQGARSAKALAGHALNLLSVHDVIQITSPQHLEEWVVETGEKPKVFLFSEKQKIPTLFKALSVAFDGTVGFGFVPSSNDALVQQFQVTEFPKIILMILRDPPLTENGDPNFGFVGYEGGLNFPAIFQWLSPLAPQEDGGDQTQGNQGDQAKDAEISVAHVVSQDDFQHECFDRLGLCVVAFLDDDESNAAIAGESQHLETLLKIAQKHPHDPYHFAWIAREGQSALMNAFGLSYDGPISIVVMNARKKAYINYIGSYTEDSIYEYLQNVLIGKLRTSKIKEIPEVVSTTTDSDVEDNGAGEEYGSAVDRDDEVHCEDGNCEKVVKDENQNGEKVKEEL